MQTTAVLDDYELEHLDLHLDVDNFHELNVDHHDYDRPDPGDIIQCHG